MCVSGSCSFPLSSLPSCLVLRLVEQRVKEEEGEGQRESAGKAFGFKPQAWRKKNLRNTTRTMNGYGWRSFCRRQGPACHAPRLRQQFLALEKQNQPLEVQPTLQLAHPLELAPPLDLSPRLVQGAPAADRPRMVGPATLALAAAESARDIVFSLGTPIAHAWRITSGTRHGPIFIISQQRQCCCCLHLHPYLPSGRNGCNKKKLSINRKNSGKGTSGIGK